MLLNTLPLQITAKLYTHSQIEFVNYTKQLFLNRIDPRAPASARSRESQTARQRPSAPAMQRFY